MPLRPLLALVAAALIVCGCAPPGENRANAAGNEYLDCLYAAADQKTDNPLSAEQIAVAAHAQCWNQWHAFRERTLAGFTSRAKTPEEMQLARDKADAHLRQFEFEARKGVMSRVVQRTYGVPGAAR